MQKHHQPITENFVPDDIFDRVTVSDGRTSRWDEMPQASCKRRLIIVNENVMSSGSHRPVIISSRQHGWGAFVPPPRARCLAGHIPVIARLGSNVLSLRIFPIRASRYTSFCTRKSLVSRLSSRLNRPNSSKPATLHLYCYRSDSFV